ncbi:membrane-associated Zn-dependent proteases 1 [Candidatus Scalindua japonica]|uniref:Membrane-associated Zn-dependent proteases 1 n=1 Tax=Candidatus Scalindua japonica TaxID=1284222 RepID=A0A286TUZ1_9BACT|nr:SpoIVB peptidase S55 domain-containing protein [Candidatus Scalindua japonica]GAX59696.1 membrane-associated Zn-dependent proteases 1 [Candidatus Scalindua japonica]
MDTDEIKPGMKGYGRTVFSGKQIESFDIEVLGVLKNWEAKNDMILIKMSGGPLEKTGIIAGMSGSPVYIDDKLIGAVSHGWSYSKDAIAGVTPIRAMIDVMEMDSRNRKNLAAKANRIWSTSLNTQDTNVIAKLESYGLLHKYEFHENTDTREPFIFNLVPIQTPLIVSGFSNESLTKISPLFGRVGRFSLHSSNGEYGSPEDLVNFMPGSSIAVEIIRGDLSVSAVGTLTYRDGNDILAFGHPIIQIGNTDMPMATAEVHTILASQASSTKMASPGKIIGRITQDRRSAIAGKIGEYTQMLPCQVKIQGSLNIEYNFEVVQDRILTPILVQMAIENAILTTEKTVGEKSMMIKLDIGIADREEPISIENKYFDSGPSWLPIYNVIEPITILLNNEFKTAKIESINLVADISEHNNVAFIDNIKVSNKWVSPGEEVLMNISVKQYARSYASIPLTIKIPDDVAPGSSIQVIVCDAMNSKMLEMTSAPGSFLPSSFEQLIHHLENEEHNSNIIVKLRLNKKGLTYMGEDFPSLPNSFLSIMSLSNQSGVTPLRSEIVKRIPTEWFINGKQTINLFVDNKS